MSKATFTLQPQLPISGTTSYGTCCLGEVKLSAIRVVFAVSAILFYLGLATASANAIDWKGPSCVTEIGYVLSGVSLVTSACSLRILAHHARILPECYYSKFPLYVNTDPQTNLTHVIF